MNTTQLRAFLVVAQTASFSRAAEELHLTQPAVSKRVAQLEDELDIRLLDRIGRQVSLTEAGRALLPRAQRILAEMEDSRRAIQNLAGAVAGPLRLGTSHHVGQHHLPAVLRRYSTLHPAVVLDLHFLDSETACAAVSQGELDRSALLRLRPHSCARKREANSRERPRAPPRPAARAPDHHARNPRAGLRAARCAHQVQL